MSLLLAALLALDQPEPPEDAAHRADRRRTQQLNRSAAAAIVRRDHGNAGVRDTNRAAMERYERERAAWRRRYEACVAGDWRACD